MGSNKAFWTSMVSRTRTLLKTGLQAMLTTMSRPRLQRRKLLKLNKRGKGRGNTAEVMVILLLIQHWTQLLVQRQKKKRLRGRRRRKRKRKRKKRPRKPPPQQQQPVMLLWRGGIRGEEKEEEKEKEGRTGFRLISFHVIFPPSLARFKNEIHGLGLIYVECK